MRSKSNVHQLVSGITNAIEYSNKKEKNINTCNINKAKKIMLNERSQAQKTTKGYTLYNSIYDILAKPQCWSRSVVVQHGGGEKGDKGKGV